MTETARPHADLGASTSPRWINCPGCINLIRTLPVEIRDRASSYALEGTAMHRAGEQWLTTQREPDWALFEWRGIELDTDCADAVKLYVNTVWTDQREFGGDLLVEKKFSLARLRPDMWGTNDAILARCKDRVLRVYDFKGGKGVVVEVPNNSQLLYYAYGAILNLPGINIDTVELIVVQPRARHPEGPIRRWRIDLIDAYDWSVRLKIAADRTDDPAAPLIAGPWCKENFCPAAGVCKTYRDYISAQAGIDFANVQPPKALPDPRAMTAAELARMLPLCEVAEQYAKLVWECAHAIADRGVPIPRYKLVAKRGKRQWMQEDRDTIAGLHELGLSNEKIFKTELKSPAQIEKVLPKEQRGRLGELCAMVSSGTTLVPEDDPKPAVIPQGFAAFPALPPGEDAAALPPGLQ